MSYLVHKYIGLLSPQLQHFKKKHEHLYNFRCPFCGDSKRNPRKTRGDIYLKNGSWSFHCHKCGTSMYFDQFLKDRDPSLYRDYITEKFQKPKEEKIIETKVPVFKDSGALHSLPSIAELPHYHTAYQYIKNRKIPEEAFSRLYYCHSFKEFTNKLIPDKLSGLEESRLLIPLLDENNKMFGYSGRSFERDAPLRYINIILNESVPKLFGLDKLDVGRAIFVVEGPLDSLFLPNCLATLGGDMVSAIGEDGGAGDVTLIYDNEPRSPFTKKKIFKAIEYNYKVVIWPKGLCYKDINDMVQRGEFSIEEILSIISENTFSGLKAKLQLSII